MDDDKIERNALFSPYLQVRDYCRANLQLAIPIITRPHVVVDVIEELLMGISFCCRLLPLLPLQYKFLALSYRFCPEGLDFISL